MKALISFSLVYYRSRRSSTMDKFGRGRVQRGPPGPSGKDAFNLYHWCPTVLLHLFRESEKCTYFFNTATDGIVVNDGSKIFLKDQNGANNAPCLKNYEKPVAYQDVFILPLRGALYQIDHISQALTPPSITVFAFNFKLARNPPVGTHFIFSNWSKTRGVYFTKDHLDICGTDPSMLTYEKEDWNRMIIQYSNFDFTEGCSFMLNGQKGFFVRKPVKKPDKETIFLGGHPKLERSSDVYISNFEIYTKIFENSNPANYQLPDEILNVINAEFLDRTS